MRRERRPRPLVLVVADDASQRALAEAALREGGFDVAVASCGKDAVARYSAVHPDAVLVDLSAGEPDGYAVCSRIRAMPAGTRVPIILTTLLDDASIGRAYACGATDFITAAVTHHVLVHRVRHLVHAARAGLDVDEAVASLERTQRLASVVQWRLDPEARTFRWSSRSDEIFGGLAGEGTPEGALLRWVHPADRARVKSALSRLEPHHVEYRLVLPSGEERVVHQDAETAVDAFTGRANLVGTAHDVTALRAAEEQVGRLAYYDELTDLPNRAHACRFLKAALAEAKLRSQCVAVISIDLDLFRRVNDSIGHVAGNVLLQEVAERLRRVVSEQADRQRRPEPLVARLGGDEFAVILRNVAGEDEASALFALVSAHLAEPYEVLGARVVVSCSAGIATYPESGVDVDALLMRADAAMHAAKDRGRDCCQAFSAEIQKRLERRRDVESRLRGALASGRGLELHYQPKVAISSLRVVGVEALLRWAPDGGTPIAPTELVSVAEETGLMMALGDWVLRTACLQAAQWSRGSHPLRVAVNISARQFSAADFADKVAQVLTESKLPPDLLELEITEGVVMVDSVATGRMLDRLKAQGVHIALDDFGTGFSSLAYLARFPIDVLKIDRSFVVEIGVTAKSEAIVGAIIALARSLDIDIVAEGVETEEQRSFLETFGELEIQGWLFSKALRPEALAAWLDDHAAREDLRIDLAS